MEKITKPVTLFENTKPNTRKLEAGLEYSGFEFELPGQAAKRFLQL